VLRAVLDRHVLIVLGGGRLRRRQTGSGAARRYGETHGEGNCSRSWSHDPSFDPGPEGRLRTALRPSKDPVVHEHLGDVYKDLRLFKLAKEQYQKSLTADRASARVKAKLESLR